MEIRLAHAALVALASGCTVPPPFHTLQTASTLPAGGVSVMAAGGGGGGEGLHSCCGGAAARVRVGIGGDQELGIDGNAIFSKNEVAGGFRLGYKLAPSARLAVLAGAGAFFIERLPSAGLDLGAVVSLRQSSETVVPYTGLRLAGAIPIDSDLYSGGGLSQTMTIPIGVSVRLGPRWQGMAELGGLGALSEARSGTSGMVETQTNLGLYGALAIGWQR